jgi:endonuclease G
MLPPTNGTGTTNGAGANEAVEIDMSNYDERNGYNPKFLEDGLVVPLPKVISTKFGKPLKVSGNKTELKYWNYSVVMNADRGLAFFSAANVFPKNPNTSQDGNNFERDPRVDDVDESAQLGREFYKRQGEFEAEDRTKNPFDQGHLSRREDLQWGKTKKLAKRNGDDSFHYTNCAPQHFEFNQNRKTSGIWYRLEKSAVDALSVGDNLCIINGPVFDAPLCKAGPDGILRLNLKGPRKPDLKFGEVKIPRLYFKVIAYNDEGELRAKAFVVTQEDLLETVDRMHEDEAAALTDAEIRLYQVKVPDLEKLTGLKFGLPASALAPLPEERTRIDEGLPIESEADVIFS